MRSIVSKLFWIFGFFLYLQGPLAIRFSVFRQTLSDINLDRSKVKSDKLLCVNTA